jgi:hypothetical protein
VTGREWPGGHFLFFVSPKKRKQKKGDCKTLPFGFPLLRQRLKRISLQKQLQVQVHKR